MKNYTTVSNSASVVNTKANNYILTGMIEDAEESYAELTDRIDDDYYASIRDRLISIAETLKSAIDTAVEASNDENITEPQIEEAFETLRDAGKTAFDALYDLLITDVEEKIAAIDNVSYDTLQDAGSKIAEARYRYDNSLTDLQKGEVENYQTLIAAEEKYAELKNNKMLQMQ